MGAQRNTFRAAACAIAAGALAAGAAPAVAADELIATVARPTTVDAYGGRAVWSAWDASARAYRLTESAGGRVRALPVRRSRVAFDVDLGPGPRGGTLAVYSRCRRPPVTTWALNGRRGCDLYAYDFARGRETRLSRANSRADERWPTVWRSRLAFTRTYAPARGRSRRFLYWRPLDGRGASHRLARGPLDRGEAIPDQLDLNGRRLAFVWTYEYGADVRLDTIGGRARRVVRIPGSGAAANQLAGQGPTVAGGAVNWALAVGGDAPVFSEIRRHDLSTGRNTRATARIEAEPTARRATEGFSEAGGASWYVRTAGRASYEIHRATGLVYEKAPPIRLE